MTTTTPAVVPVYETAKRILIIQEIKNKANKNEPFYQPVNPPGLPICHSGSYRSYLLNLPLRFMKKLTELFNDEMYRGWAIVGVVTYHDLIDEGKYYAVVVEEARGMVPGR